MAIFRSVSSVSISGKNFLILRDCLQHVSWRGVVAKSFAHVNEEILIPGREHKTASKLQRIFAQAMLFVSCSFCSLAGLQIIFAKEVQQSRVAQTNSLIGFALVIDQQRKLDAGSLAEEFSIAGIAQANHGKACAFLLKLGFKFAQLRDVLSAEDSTVMAKEDDHSRTSLPQRSKTRRFAVGVWQSYSSQLAAQ